MSIVELKTRPIKVVDSVIERLETILKEAREGKISSLAIAVVDDEGAMNCCWSDSEDTGRLIGSVARLQHRLNLSIDDASR